MNDFSILTGPLGYFDSTKEKKEVVFITEFAILSKNPPLYEVKMIFG